MLKTKMDNIFISTPAARHPPADIVRVKSHSAFWTCSGVKQQQLIKSQLTKITPKTNNSQLNRFSMGIAMLE